VNRHVAAYVAELHVEGEPAAVREERLLVEPIDPGTEKRDAAHARPRLELLERAIWPVQDVLALHVHLEGDVADGRNDRDGRLRSRIPQLHDVAIADGRVWLRNRRRGRGEAEGDEGCRGADHEAYRTPKASSLTNRRIAVNGV